MLGEYTKSSISLNGSLVGSESADGNRILSEGEQVVYSINGREYVIEATKDGLTTSKITEIAKELINQDTSTLDKSPALARSRKPGRRLSMVSGFCSWRARL